MMDSNGGNGMIMPVAPTGGGFGGGFGGDGGFWIILLFILLGGWNNNGYGAGNYGGGGLYPWMNQSQQINDGFRDQMINGNITGIQGAITTGFGDVQNALCGGFAGVNANIMQQGFGLQSQLAQCCCDNRAATADLKYTVATENCADRTAAMQNTRDIIESNTRNTQAIIDKLCQLELDGVKNQLAQAQRENVGLQNQLNMATLRESQTAQNAFIQQGFSNEVDQLYNRLNSCPVPTTPVYGRTPIFTCNNQGCGCGCNG